MIISKRARVLVTGIFLVLRHRHQPLFRVRALGSSKLLGQAEVPTAACYGCGSLALDKVV